MCELKNGARLLEGTRIVSGSNEGARIVLCRRDKGMKFPEYVTWLVDEEGNAFWGHYHDQNLTAAVEDYDKRVGQHRVIQGEHAADYQQFWTMDNKAGHTSPAFTPPSDA